MVAYVTKRIMRLVGVPFSLYFKAPWNEDMFLEAGDYLVKDGNNGYYRIESQAFINTYKFTK